MKSVSDGTLGGDVCVYMCLWRTGVSMENTDLLIFCKVLLLSFVGILFPSYSLRTAIETSCLCAAWCLLHSGGSPDENASVTPDLDTCARGQPDCVRVSLSEIEIRKSV